MPEPERAEGDPPSKASALVQDFLRRTWRGRAGMLLGLASEWLLTLVLLVPYVFMRVHDWWVEKRPPVYRDTPDEYRSREYRAASALPAVVLLQREAELGATTKFVLGGLLIVITVGLVGGAAWLVLTGETND